jgi:hypothetical protein
MAMDRPDSQEPRFELWRYAPPASHFTAEEHEEARQQGFANAVDRWVDRMDYLQWVDWQESIHQRGRNLFKRDLESVGLGGSAFDALGRAWRGTTAGASGAQHEDRLPRLLEIQDRLEEMEVSLDMDDTEVPAPDRSEFREIKEELNGIARQMRASDVDGALREAANSPRPGGGLPEMEDYVPRNPEVRAIHDAYQKDLAKYRARHPELYGPDAEPSSSVQEVPDRPVDTSETARWDADEDSLEVDEWQDGQSEFNTEWNSSHEDSV